jgi:UDP-glucose 4-epimerase
MTQYLVTGGAGFVGSHLVEALVEDGHRVRVLDNLPTGNLANLAGVRDRVELIPGDVHNLGVVRSAVRGVEVVFHLAAPPATEPEITRTEVAPPVPSTDTLHDASSGTVREEGPAALPAPGTDTMHVLIAARDAGVRRVVYGSCASVYTDPRVEHRLAETAPTFPGTPQGFAKLIGEQHCLVFNGTYGLDTIRLRYFDIFGPRQSPGSPCAPVIAILQAMLAGQRPRLHAKTSHLGRDMIYVGDAVHATVLAADLPRGAGKVFNIGRGRPITLFDVVSLVNAILGTTLHPVPDIGPAAPGLHLLADVARAETELGFCAGTDMEHGLRQCLAYYKHRRHQPEAPPKPHRLGDQEQEIEAATAASLAAAAIGATGDAPRKNGAP